MAHKILGQYTDKCTSQGQFQITETRGVDEKKSKGCTEDTGSKITTEQNSNRSSKKHSNCNNKGASNDTTNENSKNSEVKKPDYIHVRARRGQATDSHSLAERVSLKKQFLRGREQDFWNLQWFKILYFVDYAGQAGKNQREDEIPARFSTRLQ